MSLSSPASSRTPGYPVLKKRIGATGCQHVCFFYNYKAFSWPFWHRISCGVCKEEHQYSKSSVSYVIRIFKRSEISKLCFIFRLQQLCCRELGPRTRMRCKFPAACTEEGCSVATWQKWGWVPLRWLVGSHQATWGGIGISNQTSSNAFTQIQLELDKIHKFAGTGCFCFNGSSFSKLICWNHFFHLPGTFSI